MSASIVIDRLSKRYKPKLPPALDGLSLHVDPGEVYGFLGANGAGKSTTIRLLLNFLQPTGGSAKIVDLDSVRDSVAVKKHVGYLSGDVALYPKPTGNELLDYLGKLQPGGSREYRLTLEKRFEADLLKPLGDLSKGNRQKIGILQAFMHQPAVLILDEPSSGLDPLMQEALYRTIAEAKARGAAIFMSSHNLAEAQRVCDRIGIIKHGKLIREQAIDASSELGMPVFRVTLSDHTKLNQLRAAPHLKLISQVDSNTLLLQPTDSIAKALAALSSYDIRDLTSQRLDLEDEFLEFYGDNK